jgi:hypothetical protein
MLPSATGAKRRLSSSMTPAARNEPSISSGAFEEQLTDSEVGPELPETFGTSIRLLPPNRYETPRDRRNAR